MPIYRENEIAYGHLMQTDDDCGPECVKTATGKTRKEVKKVMYWKNKKDSSIENLLDSPLHHYIALDRLGFKACIVDDNEILKGNLPKTNVVILVHPDKEDIYYQHWVVLADIFLNKIYLLWGGAKNPIKDFTFDRFKEMYRDGFPNCAYVVRPKNENIPGEEYYKITIWDRMYVWLTKILVFIYCIFK